ncbi:Zn-ribbon containing protein [Halanaeroarchaeum sp. HSR-CO]|uniref:Zn-ribbon domain-containing protein n=1 Tax=Halanaeroarchaeum sp. HSR-CO TaxID=2866382 RepID=UPI00217EA3F2|nr:Zn-ribbon domain-containing protein [Halanaeroarchaeum sp. HSR-CO]UWG49139.1 Zn-ribbon containing protein [Halanaeroarchaeum sp. HSR-CO]
MPHQCTTCGQTFADGSKEMLSGCPQCGGNKFQYLPSDVLDDGTGASPPPDEKPPSRDEDTSGMTEAVGRAATTVRDYVSRHGSQPDERTGTGGGTDTTSSGRTDESAPKPDESIQDDAEPLPSSADDENSAQASARGEMVDRSELPTETEPTSSTPPGEGRVVKEPDSTDSVDRPELDDLRRELNEQFESIRIVAPGQYELNLMELYDREEHIIALQEDGRYVIQVPDSWRDEDED